MTIVPDTKDWTWVLERRCPECGVEAASIIREDVPTMLRANAAAWRQVLAGSRPHARPRPDRWSPLEYACHVRDVCRVYTERLRLMLTTDAPTYPNWDQDATAEEDRYTEQEPATVAAELTAAAEHLADRFAEVDGARWERTGTRGDGAHFTVDTFARYPNAGQCAGLQPGGDCPAREGPVTVELDQFVLEVAAARMTSSSRVRCRPCAGTS